MSCPNACSLDLWAGMQANFPDRTISTPAGSARRLASCLPLSPPPSPLLVTFSNYPIGGVASLESLGEAKQNGGGPKHGEDPSRYLGVCLVFLFALFAIFPRVACPIAHGLLEGSQASPSSMGRFVGVVTCGSFIGARGAVHGLFSNFLQLSGPGQHRHTRTAGVAGARACIMQTGPFQPRPAK
jgi:hypothetical protein